MLSLPGNLNIYKESEQYYIVNNIYIIDPIKDIPEKPFVESILLLLQGIPSDYFSFSLELFSFEPTIDNSCTLLGSPRIVKVIY